MLLENRINRKKDILIFVHANKKKILKKLKKRKGFNSLLLKKFKNIQFSTEYKKNKSNFIIKNDFTKKSVKKSVKLILRKIFK